MFLTEAVVNSLGPAVDVDMDEKAVRPVQETDLPPRNEHFCHEDRLKRFVTLTDVTVLLSKPWKSMVKGGSR